ncbi:MAG: lipopolysaccharide transport periplasmic protein LptA [Proteobacteria bacterium]|jgi:lipopolysaccharide export system protein LptA|nr:lipopolysaccharide transport periplasmic protein LptA [Pseudomonadota bacterium]
MSSAARIGLLCLYLTGQPAWGLDSDRKQPVNITADHITVVEKKGYSRYQGNVLLTQGSLKITGDDLTVFVAQNKLRKIIVLGQPASLLQLPEGQAEPMHSRAHKMEYRVDEQLIDLIGNAEVWQGPNRFSGEHITYHTNTGTITGEKGKEDGGRVSITITPPPEDNGKTTAP